MGEVRDLLNRITVDQDRALGGNNYDTNEDDPFGREIL
jgi:hypothetical protein